MKYCAFSLSVVEGIFYSKHAMQADRMQGARKVSVDYIDSIITHDLPPNAHKLRAL